MNTCEEYVLNRIEKLEEEKNSNELVIKKLEEENNELKDIIKLFLKRYNISKFSNSENHYLDINYYSWEIENLKKLMKAGILNFLKPEDREILLNDYPDYNEIDME